jgi:hypothetical protein
MDSFYHTIASWIPHCGGDWFDPVTTEELLELAAREFSPIIEDNPGWSGIAAKPLAVKEEGNMVACFVLDGHELWQSGGLINARQGVNFFNSAAAWDSR